MAFKLEVTGKLPFFGRKADPEATSVLTRAKPAQAAGTRRLQLLIAALIALLLGLVLGWRRRRAAAPPT